MIYNSYLAIACNVPSAFFVILAALLGHKFNTKLRIIGSQFFIILVFIVISSLTLVDTDSWQKTFLDLNLPLIAVMVSFSGVLQGSSSAIFGKFSVEIIGALSVGAAIGGLAPSIINVIIIALQSDPKMTGLVTNAIIFC